MEITLGLIYLTGGFLALFTNAFSKPEAERRKLGLPPINR